jgi:hypothetical protein
MPAFRGPDGRVIYAPDDEADRYRAGGEYQEIGGAEAGATQNRIAPTDNGVLGSIGATVSGALSGATLGASDWLLKGVLDKGQFDQLAQDRADNPILAGAAQTAGMVLPALVSGGAATPAGALSRAAAGSIEAGRATGGALGLAQQLGAAAGEGAIANAGIYLSDVALGDRNLTAEGINGALGTGLLFGAAGIPIAHGIEVGTIAARRMFARYAEGGAQAADAAAATWTEQAQKHLEGFDQAAELAKARLAEARLAEAQTAREAANLQRLRAGAEMADARAFTPPAEFPGSPAGAPAVPGTAAETAGVAAPGPPATPAEPPEVAMARALRDRARALGGEPITPGELPPGAPGFQRDYVIPGARGAPAPVNALDALAGESGVASMGPETSVQRLGLRRVPVTADEAELGARLAEYQDARRAFDEIHAQVDPDLDAILRGVQPGDIQRPPVPIGEFGAPGARGIKTPDELARIAAGTGREEGAQAVSLASADATGAGGPRALRSQGTPPARSLGEVAAEQAPVPVEQPATAVGKRPAEPSTSATSAASAEPGIPDRARIVGRYGKGAAPLPESEVPDHAALDRYLNRTGKDYAEATLPARSIGDRGYYEPPGGGTDAVRITNARKAIAEGQREPIKLGVSPEGKIMVTDGRHRLAAAIEADAPIKVKWTTSTEPVESDVLRGGTRAPATDTLTGQLRGTAARLGAGESLAEMGRAPAAATRATQAERAAADAGRFRAKALAGRPFEGPARPPGGHPFEVKRLEMAHDEALERAATAANPAERAAATQEAQAIEKQIAQVGARPGAVEDIAALAPAVTRIEKAAAALTEALGDVAPAVAKEHAAAFRAAEDEVNRKTVARIGQAADDAAGGRAAAQSRDPLAPPARADDDLLLGPSQKEQRIAAAQKAQREAGAVYAKARIAEAEAQIGAKQAAGAAAEARAKLGPPPPTPGAAPRGHGVGERALHAAHVVGYAAELGSDLGIPGVPRPHDIPVIGPLLSGYLKYRALRAAAGRFMGRVPATAETRAAALAARTRDGIARAVDRSLGVIERNSNTVRAALTVGTLKATDALGKRLVDDGGPDAPAKASLPEQAAVRMREVAAVIANPALIHDAIRTQGRALTDPDLIDALSNHLVTMFQRLNEIAPKGPPPNPFTGKQWTPSPADAIRFGQQVAIARDPQVAFQMLEAGTLTPTGADTLRKCYELLYRDGQQRVIQRAAELKNPVDYTQLVRLGRLFDLPLHPSQNPEHAAVLAGAHTPAAKPSPAASAQGAPPTPSIAGPTTLSNLYQPSGERAQR